MRKRNIIIMAIVLAAIVVTGCVDETNTNTEDMQNDTNIDTEGVNVGDSYWYEVEVTEKNQNKLVKERPPIVMDDSLERQNLIKRYEYLNDANNVHHVYLLSNDGKVISYFVAQGKVSSVNSKLTNDKQIVPDSRCLDETHYEGHAGCYKTVESPQMDGSYGTNGDAIFFFTTSGEYVEYNGKYVVSEKPLNVQTAVSLEHEVQYEGDSSDMSVAP